MRKEGHITVFLSLVLVCVFALMCGLLESARTAGSRCYLQIAAHSSLDSVLSQYHRELWNSYRLLFLEYENTTEIEDTFRKYMEQYLETENRYPMEIEKLEIANILHSTDDNGKHLEQEILDYMKFGIWKLDFSAEEAESLFSNLKEAGALKGVSSAYEKHSKEAMKVEEALEEIDQALQKQKRLYEESLTYLGDEDGSGFRNRAEELLAELKRIPRLVRAYEKKADQLGNSLRKTRQDMMAQQQDMTDEVRDRMNEEVRHYEEYTAKDGDRRQEITALISLAEENTVLVEETIRHALEVEEEIAEWEGEDEEDELEEEELWEPVIHRFSGYRHSTISFPHGIQDKEKKGWLEEVQKMAAGNLLALVLPKGTEVSKGIWDTSDFPSKRFAPEAGMEFSGLADKLLVNEYCGEFFSCFLTEEKKEVQYEMEYLLGNEETDEANLTAAIGQILMVREGFNLLHILADSEKREAAQILAGTIVGASGIVPLVLITAFFIMCVWALAEAIMDVRTLLEGGKISLLKTKENWQLSLDDLLQMGSRGSLKQGGGETKGLGYESYLKLLLFLKNSEQKYYQMMDVIQTNIRRKQNDFLMEYCAYRVDMKTVVWGKHVFFSLGIVENLTGGGDGRYQIQAEAQKAY